MLTARISDFMGVTPEALKTILFQDYKYYPENKAEHVWKKGDVIFSLVKQDHMLKSGLKMLEELKKKGEVIPSFILDSFSTIHREFYCGYCRFPKQPLIEKSYMNFVSYIPVHGGITYSQSQPDGSMVYGFDCAHWNDENNNSLSNIDYLKMECERMAIGIQVAIEYEQEYLLSNNKAEVIDRFLEELEKKFKIRFNLTNNFGAMINLLTNNL